MKAASLLLYIFAGKIFSIACPLAKFIKMSCAEFACFLSLSLSLLQCCATCGSYFASQQSNLSPLHGSMESNYWTARKFLFSLLDEDFSLQACCTSVGGRNSVLSRVNDFLNWWTYAYWWRKLNHFLLFSHFLNILNLNFPTPVFDFISSHIPGDVTRVCACVCEP